MKNIYLVALLFSVISSCGKKKETLSTVSTEEQKNELVEKYVNKTLSEMQHYEVQPMYMLRISQHNCTFEILVNDDIAYEDLFSIDKLASSVKINSSILKSGLQTITVRMYPIGDILQQEFGEDYRQDVLTLLNDSNVTIDVIRVDDKKNYEMENEKTVILHHSPKDAQGVFKGSGLPYYEYTFSFEAEVPYEFEAYANGVDLRTLNQEELKVKYEEYITYYKSLFLDKNIEKLFELKYPSELRAAISQYQEEDYIRQKFLELYIDYTVTDLNFYNSKGAEYMFLGNGRLISKKYPSGVLESRKLEKAVLRGNSGIFYLYDEDSEVYFLGMDLYMPQSYKGKGIHLELAP